MQQNLNASKENYTKSNIATLGVAHLSRVIIQSCPYIQYLDDWEPKRSSNYKKKTVDNTADVEGKLCLKLMYLDIRRNLWHCAQQSVYVGR